MDEAGPVDVTLVLSPREMELLYAQMITPGFTLAQIVQYFTCHGAALMELHLDRTDEALLLMGAAKRTMHHQWAEMVSQEAVLTADPK